MVSHDQSNDLMRSPGDWQPVIGPVLPTSVEGPVVPMQGVVLVTSPIPCGVHVADCTRQVVDSCEHFGWPRIVLFAPGMDSRLGAQVVGEYHLHALALTSDPRVP